MTRLLPRVSCLLIVAFGIALVSAADPPKPPVSDLVRVQAGALPIIVSAPHGGAAEVPGVTSRTGEGFTKGPKGYFTGRDTGTEELAIAIANTLNDRLEKKPYFVIAKFHRKYIDANRPADIGVENAKAKPVYEAYHQTLASYCRDVQKQFGRGLLIDVHGQGTAADTVFRGTKDGKTVELLIKRFGNPAHNGPESLFGLLEQNGCTIHPKDGAKEQSGFTGGYIVQTYGSHTGYGIDAIQLEFGMQYRNKDKTQDTADKVVRAVMDYAKKYLPDKPLVRAEKEKP